MLEDGDSFAGGWVLLRTGDSYGGSGCWPAGKTTIVMGDYLVQQGHRYGSGWLCASQSCPWITDMYVLVDVGYITECDITAIKNIRVRGLSPNGLFFSWACGMGLGRANFFFFCSSWLL